MEKVEENNIYLKYKSFVTKIIERKSTYRKSTTFKMFIQNYLVGQWGLELLEDPSPFDPVPLSALDNLQG